MLKHVFLLGLAVLASEQARAAELVLAENGACAYQIVIPDKGDSPIVDDWLVATARLTQAAFARNGFDIDVVREEAKAADKPGIYLGATTFAKQHGIEVRQLDDWTYHQKVVDRDLIIIGNDREDPPRGGARDRASLALLGTVKGACDFLREHVGVRFLYLKTGQGPEGLGRDGSLTVDTRSIAFTPTPRVAVPGDLDLRKKPMLRASDNRHAETFYTIANNFFPLLNSIQGGTVAWNHVISLEKYAASHPEYFALLTDGKRACQPSAQLSSDDLRTGQTPVCPTHPGVQDLMFQAADELFEGGDSTILIAPPDAFRLCRCNCERCLALFGRRADGWQDLYARGGSGKLWQAYFGITERLRRKHPQARIVLWDYQDTPIQTVPVFPENVIPQLQFGSQRDFERLRGIEIPAGICGLEETFTGFGIAGPYAPERTPDYVTGIVRAMARHNVQWTVRDGSMGYVRGLQAPAYYVFGRLMDDPSADPRSLVDEFCKAAFGEIAPTMISFFDQLHTQLAVYSDFFGVFMPAWDRKYGRSRFHDNKWHIKSIYTPEFLLEADGLLSSAERRARDPDVQARLRLMRIEFDYLRDLSKIFALHDVWLLDPTPTNQTALLDAIDAWRVRLEALAGGVGRTTFKPLPEWPEMRPFSGHFYGHAALEYDSYQQRWYLTCLGWDTAAIRDLASGDPARRRVGAADDTPAIDAAAWETAPAVVLRDRLHGGMPFLNVRTTLRTLRDRDNLYVRVDALYPARPPESESQAAAEADILEREHIELAIQPTAQGPIYRLAIGPTDGARYDSTWTSDARNRPVEDPAWNGRWQSATRVTGDRNTGLAQRTWTAWFQIPFATLGVAAPVADQTWGFNAARNWPRDSGNRRLVWRDGPSVTDPQTLGTLAF